MNLKVLSFCSSFLANATRPFPPSTPARYLWRDLAGLEACQTGVSDLGAAHLRAKRNTN
jgi:hypothetical protein